MDDLRSVLSNQADEMAALVEKLEEGNRAHLCHGNPDDELPGDRVEGDVGATNAFWVREGQRAGGLVTVPALNRGWMPLTDQWDGVVGLRAVSEGGKQMLEESIDLVVGVVEASTPGPTWAMSAAGEVDLDGFVKKVIAHGEYHLAKLRAAVADIRDGETFQVNTDL